jgi:hypothetical protein
MKDVGFKVNSHNMADKDRIWYLYRTLTKLCIYPSGYADSPVAFPHLSTYNRIYNG